MSDIQQQEGQSGGSGKDEIFKEIKYFFQNSRVEIDDAEIEERYSVFSGEPILEIRASNKGTTAPAIHEPISEIVQTHNSMTVNDFLKYHNPDFITKVRYEYWPSNIALPKEYLLRVRRKAAWEGSIYNRLRKLRVGASDALQYHGLGILFPTGLLEVVINAYFEPIGEGIYRIKPEIRTAISTSGSIENVATGNQYQIGPSGMVSFKGYIGRFGLQFNTKGNVGGNSYEGIFKLVGVAGLSKASLVIYDVTPALFQQYKIDEFCKKHRVSMEYIAHVLAHGGRISKDFFIGRGAVNLKDLSGAEAEVSFLIKMVGQLNDGTLPSSRIKLLPQVNSETIDNFRADLLVVDDENKKIVSHELKKGELTNIIKDHTFKNLINLLATASLEWLDDSGAPTCNLTFFHLAKQKYAANWNTFITEFVSCHRVEDGTSRLIGNYTSFKQISVDTGEGIWEVNNGMQVRVQYTLKSKTADVAVFEIRRQIFTRDTHIPERAWQLSYDGWEEPMIATFVQDLDPDTSLMSRFENSIALMRAPKMRADVEEMTATTAGQAELKDIMEDILGRKLIGDSFWKGKWSYRFYIQVAISLFGEDVALDPDQLEYAFGHLFLSEGSKKAFKEALQDPVLGYTTVIEHNFKLFGQGFITSEIFAKSKKAAESLIKSYDSAVEKLEDLVENIVQDITGEELREFIQVEGGCWQAYHSIDKIVTFFHQVFERMRINGLFPKSIYEGLVTSASSAKATENLALRLQSLNFSTSQQLTEGGSKGSNWKQSGYPLKQAWLDVWKSVIEPEVAAAGVKIASSAWNSENTANNRVRRLGVVLARAIINGNWCNVIRSIAALLPETTAMQFKASTSEALFYILATRSIGNWTYAHIKWAPIHKDGIPREYIVRYLKSGNLYRDGFEAFVDWATVTKRNVTRAKHFYSTVPPEAMDGVWNQIRAGKFDPSLLPKPWRFNFANHRWFLDLVDPSANIA